ncbi:hypothetical protein VKT23_000309 [Stygiomarasmius scandens]|uniref:Uncharacterized protein n=1 Tax=Marasmiellus scandens TaxID=2682957 RepID=A0ABR1K7L8_9AGAR
MLTGSVSQSMNNVPPMTTSTGAPDSSLVQSPEPKDNHPLLSSTSVPGSPQTRLIEVNSGSSTESSSGDSHPNPSPTPSLFRSNSGELLSQTPARTSISSNAPSKFVSSPLNPSSSPPPTLFGPKRPHNPHARPNFPRIASEDARTLSMANTLSSRGSMILYRFTDPSDELGLPPPPIQDHPNRASVASSSGDSIISLTSDSKYPSNYNTISERGVVAYAYDPSYDESKTDDIDDELHNPASKETDRISTRGFVNLTALLLLVLGLMALFVIYPAITLTRLNNSKENTIRNCINETGQMEESLPGCATFRVQNAGAVNNADTGTNADVDGGVDAGTVTASAVDADTTVVVKRDQFPIYELVYSTPFNSELESGSESVEVGYEGFDLVFSENDDEASSSTLDKQGGELEIPICAREGDFFVEVRLRPGLDEGWETAFWSYGVWDQRPLPKLAQQHRSSSRRTERRYSVLEVYLPPSEAEMDVDRIRVFQRSSTSSDSCGSSGPRQYLDLADALDLQRT